MESNRANIVFSSNIKNKRTLCSTTRESAGNETPGETPFVAASNLARATTRLSVFAASSRRNYA